MTQRIVSLREIRLGCITNCLTDNSRKSSYISQTNSILYSKAKCLRKVNISFTGYSVKQHDTVEYLACQLDSKLSGENIGIKNPSESKPQTKISLSKKQIPNFYVEKTIIQRANSATFRLRMFFMVSSFK